VHVRAGETNRADADERDQRHEQRVLEQVLAVFVVHERDEASDQTHVHSSVAQPRPNAVCAKCDHAWLRGSRARATKGNAYATAVFSGAPHTRNFGTWAQLAVIARASKAGRRPPRSGSGRGTFVIERANCVGSCESRKGTHARRRAKSARNGPFAPGNGYCHIWSRRSVCRVWMPGKEGRHATRSS